MKDTELIIRELAREFSTGSTSGPTQWAFYASSQKTAMLALRILRCHGRRKLEHFLLLLRDYRESDLR